MRIQPALGRFFRADEIAPRAGTQSWSSTIAPGPNALAPTSRSSAGACGSATSISPSSACRLNRFEVWLTMSGRRLHPDGHGRRGPAAAVVRADAARPARHGREGAAARRRDDPAGAPGHRADRRCRRRGASGDESRPGPDRPDGVPAACRRARFRPAGDADGPGHHGAVGRLRQLGRSAHQPRPGALPRDGVAPGARRRTISTGPPTGRRESADRSRRRGSGPGDRLRGDPAVPADRISDRGTAEAVLRT